MQRDIQCSSSREYDYNNRNDEKPQVALKATLGEVLVDLSKKRGPLNDPVPEEFRKKRSTLPRYPVLHSMEGMKGPLSLLSQSILNKRRIKVGTRGVKTIRGYCVGYLVAYDKHFNLAMKDVDEMFIDPKLRMSKQKYDKYVSDVLEVDIPLMNFTEKRHVNQMFIRGDNICTISLV